MTAESNYRIEIARLYSDWLKGPMLDFQPMSSKTKTNCTMKCSAIGIGFNGAETNCRIALILGILLMNSCNTDKFLATTIICSLSALN